MPFHCNYAQLNSSGLHFRSHFSACLWHWWQMLWPIPSAGGTNCGCTQSSTACQQQVTTVVQTHNHLHVQSSCNNAMIPVFSSESVSGSRMEFILIVLHTLEARRHTVLHWGDLWTAGKKSMAQFRRTDSTCNQVTKNNNTEELKKPSLYWSCCFFVCTSIMAKMQLRLPGVYQVRKCMWRWLTRFNRFTITSFVDFNVIMVFELWRACHCCTWSSKSHAWTERVGRDTTDHLLTMLS